MKTTILFFCLIFGISTSTWGNVTVEEEENHLEIHQPWKEIVDITTCSSGFQAVGDRCLIVDKTLSGPWEMMRAVCVDLGGDLPNLENANFLADINDYLIDNDLDDVSYWVGSNDQVTEGEWTWVNDDSIVKMGTPLWGDLADGIQQPTGGSLLNCGVLLQGDHYFMHDAECTEPYSLLCEEFVDKPTERTTKTVSSSLVLRNADDNFTAAVCPFPYEMIYGQCVFINTLAEDTWYAQRGFCKDLGGHIIIIDDANFLGAIYDRLMEAGINTTFWIGASDEEQEGDWRWLDNTPVQLGTPFWGDDDDEIQEPDGGTGQNCAGAAYGYHYFFGDANCDVLFNVICQMDF